MEAHYSLLHCVYAKLKDCQSNQNQKTGKGTTDIQTDMNYENKTSKFSKSQSQKSKHNNTKINDITGNEAM